MISYAESKDHLAVCSDYLGLCCAPWGLRVSFGRSRPKQTDLVPGKGQFG
jgi:hypothetical protein